MHYLRKFRSAVEVIQASAKLLKLITYFVRFLLPLAKTQLGSSEVIFAPARQADCCFSTYVSIPKANILLRCYRALVQLNGESVLHKLQHSCLWEVPTVLAGSSNPGKPPWFSASPHWLSVLPSMYSSAPAPLSGHVMLLQQARWHYQLFLTRIPWVSFLDKHSNKQLGVTRVSGLFVNVFLSNTHFSFKMPLPPFLKEGDMQKFRDKTIKLFGTQQSCN